MSEQSTKHLQPGNLVVITFAEAKQPKFREVKGGTYVRFGDDNLYPEYLLQLFDQATKHGGIVSGKAAYVAGNGWQVKDGAEDPAAAAWMARVNRHGETLAEVTRKAALDEEIFGGYYLQVIWTAGTRRIAEVYHVDYIRMRTNRDNTQFMYKEDWSLHRGEIIPFAAFNPAAPFGTQILYVKSYRPGLKAYALPDYMRALNYISAEIEVGKHTYTNAKAGFSASKSITLTNGEPESEADKKKITRKIENAWSGEGGKKFIINFTNSKDEAPVIDDLGASDLTKEDHTAVDNLIQGNIYTGHKITTPALFGIATPGQLGQDTKLRDGYEIFRKTYVNDKQQRLETTINRLARLAGVTVPLSIVPTEPIDIEIDPATIAAAMTTDEIREKAGLKPLQPGQAVSNPAAAPGGQPAPAQQLDASGAPAPTNEALRSLTGKQHQQLLRIIRQVGKGQLTREQASVLLKSSLGLSDEEITRLLGAPDGGKFSDSQELDEDAQIAVFAEFGAPRAGYTILKSRKVRFAEDPITELQVKILEAISKDKLVTVEAMAEAFGAGILDVTEALHQLEASGAVKASGAEGAEERVLTKPLKDLAGDAKQTREFKIMYTYEGPQDARNRPFCAKLMQLGRMYTRADIEAISNRLGYSVWDRRGGFYHNTQTGETTPYCRHTWVSHVVIKNGK